MSKTLLIGKAYRVERFSRQRDDARSSYPLVRWWVIRRIDQRVVGEFDTRRDAVARFNELEAL
jgi:hypothetical protein